MLLKDICAASFVIIQCILDVKIGDLNPAAVVDGAQTFNMLVKTLPTNTCSWTCSLSYVFLCFRESKEYCKFAHVTSGFDA